MKIANLLPILIVAAACSTAQTNSRATAAPSPSHSASLASARETHFVDSLLSVMTLEEKIGQLTMSPAEGLQTGPQRPAGSTAQVRAGLVGSIIGVWGADRTHALQKLVVEESPHRIPILFSLDVIHGYRTVFPVPLAEAASFDPSLAQSDARIAAAEATANGITWTFAPMVDIARDPRWGRIVEGAGEEPYLGAVMAAARVHGFQGTSLSDPASMLATAKHYAGYGASEGGRDYATAEISERTFALSVRDTMYLMQSTFEPRPILYSTAPVLEHRHHVDRRELDVRAPHRDVPRRLRSRRSDVRRHALRRLSASSADEAMGAAGRAVHRLDAPLLSKSGERDIGARQLPRVERDG